MNPQQQRAVETTEGKVLILAGAGTGKTTVLTRRMAHLIGNKGVPPESILGLTFTNKAAEEMRHRLASFIDPKKARAVTLCTFHSFCVKILRQEIDQLGYTKDFTIYQPSDVERLVKTIVREILGRDGELPSLAPSMKVIADARSAGIKPEDLPHSGKWHDTFIQELYQKLEESMRAHNAVDFDSMLCLTAELFEKFPATLQKYRDRYHYIMIDEFQDTNPIQYKIASQIAQENLCVVGDDDQSIYGWRGADIRNILDFSGATVIKLEQNYRSTATILNAANALIKNNPQRHEKELKSTTTTGEPITIFHAPTEREEAEAVIYRIVKMKEKQGRKWSDFAILYRSNALSRQLEHVFHRTSWLTNDGTYVRGIPYQIFGGTEFFERREVKDLFAYLRVIANPDDQMALLRIINVPRRGVGDTTLDTLTAYNRTHNTSLWEVLRNAQDLGITNQRSLQGIEQFLSIIEEGKHRFETTPLSEAMKWLIERVDYKQAIKEEVKSQKMREMKWENVQELVSSIAEFQDSADSPSLRAYIESTALDQDKKSEKADPSVDKVQLMTFHSAKGLEFPVCFLIGIEDKIIPHERSVKEGTLEEERRLLYVAITRAKEKLFLSMSQKRNKMGTETPSMPSPFLYEIPKELLSASRFDQMENELQK